MNLTQQHIELGNFWSWIDRVVRKAPRKIGSVTFWRDEQDGLCYDLPSSQWDAKAIAQDIVKYYYENNQSKDFPAGS